VEHWSVEDIRLTRASLQSELRAFVFKLLRRRVVELNLAKSLLLRSSVRNLIALDVTCGQRGHQSQVKRQLLSF
jgi:hypothetical protein